MRKLKTPVLYRLFLKYEIHLIWLFRTTIFSIFLLLAAKRIFSLHLVFNSYREFIEIVALLGVLASIFSAWWSYNNEKVQRERIESARLEQQNSSQIASLEKIVLHQAATDKSLEQRLLDQQKEIKAIQAAVSQITA